MNKILRFSLLSMLMMLCGSVFADNVTVTFAAGTDKGTTTAEAPGEDHITKNGVTIAISNGAMATDQYRVYKGQTFTVTSSVGNITKIEVTCTANGTAKQGPGCLENPTSGTYSFESDGKGGVWTGNAAEVQFSTPSNQCRMTKVVVTVGEGGSDPDPDPDPDPQPDEVKVVTIAEFNAAAESTDVWYQLSGTVRNLKDGDQYGNFDLEDATGSVYVYGLLSEKGGAKKLFQELAAEKGIKNGTKITIIGNRGSYKEKIEVMNAYFVSVDGQEDDPDPQPDEIKDATVAEFNAAAESTDVWYKLSGEVKNLNDGDKYGNFDLEDATGSVYVYGLLSEKGGAKGDFQALAAEKGIKNGCKITIIGNRGSYKDKIEVTNAYFVSIDEAAPAELTISGETTFVESTVVTITPSDVDHDVYYTLDGTDPKTSSTQVRYMEPFTITESCTVKAWEEDADIYAEKTFTKAEAPAEMTVEDVIAAAPESTNATDGQQKVWVKGYIVGFVDGAKLAEGAKFTAEGCETATNLLLATNPAETNVENCIPVQLPSGDIRAALNLQDNPDNLGKEVKLYGYVLKYFSVPGLKNVTAYEFTGNTGVELQNAETIQNGKMYNLAGQRVSENYRGIVIMNGKKVIKK